MITRNDFGFEISCDSCPDESTESDASEWGDMMEEIKEEGWTNYKDDNGDWTNSCPACNEKWRQGEFS
jgi:hypothetical protein